jgi:hypothetical protein
MLTDLQTPATGLIGKPPLKLIQEETEDENEPGFYEYSHHLREAASPAGYGMHDEIIMSLVQWIEMTHGKEAMRQAVWFVTCEWDL